MTLQRNGSFAAVLGLIFGIGELGANAAPQTVFSNFGSANSYLASSFLNEAGPTSYLASISGAYYSQGEGFTPSVSGYLSSFNIPLEYADGTNDAHLFLADGSSGVPGTILESFKLTHLAYNDFSSHDTPNFVASINHPFLSAGITYFLYEAETGDEFNVWNINSIGAMDLHTLSKNGSPYSTSLAGSGAFSIQADPVPEASTTVSFGLLVALSVGSVILAAKRKKSSAAI